MAFIFFSGWVVFAEALLVGVLFLSADEERPLADLREVDTEVVFFLSGLEGMD
jgi:hypothetical protein